MSSYVTNNTTASLDKKRKPDDTVGTEAKKSKLEPVVDTAVVSKPEIPKPELVVDTGSDTSIVLLPKAFSLYLHIKKNLEHIHKTYDDDLEEYFVELGLGDDDTMFDRYKTTMRDIIDAIDKGWNVYRGHWGRCYCRKCRCGCCLSLNCSPHGSCCSCLNEVGLFNF